MIAQNVGTQHLHSDPHRQAADVNASRPRQAESGGEMGSAMMQQMMQAMQQSIQQSDAGQSMQACSSLCNR